MQRNLSAAGAPLHVFHAAVSDSLTTLPFQAEGGEAPWVRQLHLGATLLTGVGVYTTSKKRHALANTSAGPVVTVRTIDLARVVHRVSALLSRRSGNQRGGNVRRGSSRILMKLDVEGDEPRILLHLVRSQAACLIDQIMVEWHSLTLHKPELQQILSMAAPLRSQRAMDNPMASGVTALVNVSRALQGALEQALKGNDEQVDSDCRAHLKVLDDEKYYKDGVPLPGRAICEAPSTQSS